MAFANPSGYPFQQKQNYNYNHYNQNQNQNTKGANGRRRNRRKNFNQQYNHNQQYSHNQQYNHNQRYNYNQQYQNNQNQNHQNQNYQNQNYQNLNGNGLRQNRRKHFNNLKSQPYPSYHPYDEAEDIEMPDAPPLQPIAPNFTPQHFIRTVRPPGQQPFQIDADGDVLMGEAPLLTPTDQQHSLAQKAMAMQQLSNEILQQLAHEGCTEAQHWY